MRTKRSELVFHPGEVIVKPPCCSVLDLAWYASVVITTAESINYGIVGRVQGLDDHLREQPFGIKSVHESCKRSYKVSLACDSIAAAVDPGTL